MRPVVPDLPPATIDLRFVPPPVRGVRGIRVMREIDPEAGGWETIGETPGRAYRVENVPPVGETRFALAVVFEDGTVAPEEAWTVLPVNPAAAPSRPPLPSAPSGFGVAQEGGSLAFAWTPAQDGVTEEVEIREAPAAGAWNAGLFVARVPPAGSYRWPWPASGARRFFLAGVDRDGRYGPATSVDFTVSALDDHVLATTQNESGGGFAGTHSGTAVIGGNLELAAPPATASAWGAVANTYSYPAAAQMVAEGTYTATAVDNGATESERLEAEIVASTPGGAGYDPGSLIASKWTFPIHGQGLDVNGVPSRPRGRSTLDRCRGDGTPVYSPDFLVEIRTSESATATLGDVVWNPWTTFVPGVYRHRWRQFRIRIFGTGFTTCRVSTLKFHHRRKNKKDENVHALGSGDRTVTFATPFVSAPRVTFAPVGFVGVVKIISVSATQIVFRAYELANPSGIYDPGLYPDNNPAGVLVNYTPTTLDTSAFAYAEKTSGDVHWIAAGP